MHTRVRKHATLDDESVDRFTVSLIAAARRTALDEHEGMSLPGMALLALLQHHGAATPLLDISLDPLVGLYMATVSPNPEDDAKDGALFAIKRPNRHIADFDSRRFKTVYDWLGDDVAMYSAPDVSERLRIQRGHFLIGRVSNEDSRVTIPLSVDRGGVNASWIRRRMRARGSPGTPPPATSDVAVFRITSRFSKLRSVHGLRSDRV